MEVKRITPLNVRNNIQIKQQLKNNEQILSRENAAGILPTTRQYLSFMGGKSLNLAETIQNLDKLAEKDSNVYPKHIREWAGMILDGGNKAKDTLINVHKKYYENLKSCATLGEIKKKFPEFEEVLPDSEVKFSKNSFGYDVKNGLLECFDKDEDLSVQLLKIYYGDGFSLGDLKKYTGGHDVYHTMGKLNIPAQNRNYGYMLKFSDPDYNQRITAEMTYKRRLALDAKAKEEGEPVFIPRGPQSKEHREHISQGLQRFYEENPERIFTMSDKQKEFYAQNPERKQIFSRVMTKAWNFQGMDRVKFALSDFMRKNGYKDFDISELSNPAGLNRQKSLTIKKFWGTNEWASKMFSKSMKYSWKKVKEENEICFNMISVPSSLKSEIVEWIKEKNIDLSIFKQDTYMHPFLPEKNAKMLKENEDIYNVFYAQNPKIKDLMVSHYELSILDFCTSAIKTIPDEKFNKKYQAVYDLLDETYSSITEKVKGDIVSKKLELVDYQKIHNKLFNALITNKELNEYVDMLNDCIERNYKYSLENALIKELQNFANEINIITL